MSAIPKPSRASWRSARVAFCTRCNCDRPLIKIRGRAHCSVCKDRVELPNKYHSTPTRSKHTGRMFMSKKEANREPALLAMQNAGVISDLKYQQPFRLELYGTQAVDALLEHLGDLGGATEQRLKEDVRRSRQCVAKWVSDFTYLRDGQLHVEDVKGRPTPVYSLKKKLVLVACGVEIEEPGEGGIQQKARGAGIRGRGTGSRLMWGR